MKLIICLITILLASGSARSQELNGQIPSILRLDNDISVDGKSLVCGHATSFQSALLNRPDGTAIVRRPYDVLSYDLFMDWRNPLTSQSVADDGRRFSGRNTITLRIDSAGITAFKFNGVAIHIDSLFITTPVLGQIRIPDILISQPNNAEWFVSLPLATPKVGDTVSLIVYYTHIGTENRGFLLYDRLTINKNQDSIFIPERLAYTMSEPQDARYWMPCNDAPYDKAIATITVRVPFINSPDSANFSVSSNGKPTIGVPQFDGDLSSMYRDYKWSDETPIPTYLMVANASKFKQYSQWYKRVTNPNDSVEIMNFVWQEDFDNKTTDGKIYSANYAFQGVPSMMEHFSRLYGEYPFVKYGHTVAQPFLYGGMEHQTMTTVNREWLRKYNENSVAHELMHQWTGDLTSCATWGDIWLNEGGATYGEALFYESWGGESQYKIMMSSKRRGYLYTQPQPPIYGIPISNIFNYATTYCKAGWVYGMLRKTYGDSTFFRTMRKYFSEYRFKSAETEDLLRVFEKEIPDPIVPFRVFFDQWLYSAGHPIYQLQSSQTYNGVNNQEVTVTLTQTQSGENVPDIFVMPVKVTFFGRDTSRKVVSFINNKRVQTEVFYTDFVVDSAIVDANEEILCEKTNMITSIHEDVIQVQNAKVFPQPAKLGETAEFQFSIPNKGVVSVSIVSTLGQLIESLQDGVLSSGTYSLKIPTQGLSSGMYSIRLTFGNRTQEFPLIIIQ
ncbi:MAG: T9SS type A sorting domain-containing protein [Ignavibacteriae bacterium]|nr:T9SS type A sorting domain-containing protein [Ignavibacteriota bacterium]